MSSRNNNLTKTIKRSRQSRKDKEAHRGKLKNAARDKQRKRLATLRKVAEKTKLVQTNAD